MPSEPTPEDIEAAAYEALHQNLLSGGLKETQEGDSRKVFSTPGELAATAEKMRRLKSGQKGGIAISLADFGG